MARLILAEPQLAGPKARGQVYYWILLCNILILWTYIFLCIVHHWCMYIRRYLVKKWLLILCHKLFFHWKTSSVSFDNITRFCKSTVSIFHPNLKVSIFAGKAFAITLANCHRVKDFKAVKENECWQVITTRLLVTVGKGLFSILS